MVKSADQCSCCGACKIWVRPGKAQELVLEPSCSCFRWDTPLHEPCRKCRLHCTCLADQDRRRR